MVGSAGLLCNFVTNLINSNKDMIFIVVHYGGEFLSEPTQHYAGGFKRIVPSDPDYFCTTYINEQTTHLLQYHTIAKDFLKYSEGYRLIHDDDSIRDLIEAVDKDGIVEVFVDHKLDKDHPDYELNGKLLSKLVETENKKDNDFNDEDESDDANYEESESDGVNKIEDEEQLSSDEEYLSARKKFKEFTKKMRLVRDLNDTGGIDLNELQDDGAEDEDDQGTEVEGGQGAEAAEQEKAPSKSDDDEECTESDDKEWAPSEYEDSDEMRSLEEDSDEMDKEADNGEVLQPERLTRKKSIEKPTILFDPKTKKKHIQFYVGMMFSGAQKFREAVRGYALGRGKDIRYITKKTGSKFQLKCRKEKCPWRLWVSRMDETFDTLQVKSYKKKYKCSRAFKSKTGIVRFLVQFYGNRIRKNPQ